MRYYQLIGVILLRASLIQFGQALFGSNMMPTSTVALGQENKYEGTVRLGCLQAVSSGFMGFSHKVDRQRNRF
ncbi:hypothetical protein EDB19DRAFT_1686555 [Suillus lakei]|nr:hypothetical protein EDB19DRAFT_1686555 [Suillus lakei]